MVILAGALIQPYFDYACLMNAVVCMYVYACMNDTCLMYVCYAATGPCPLPYRDHNGNKP